MGSKDAACPFPPCPVRGPVPSSNGYTQMQLNPPMIPSRINRFPAPLQEESTPHPTRPKKQRSSRNRAPSHRAKVSLFVMAGCCVFLRWPSTSSHSRLGYHALDDDANEAGPSQPPATVTVVVGKERRVFAVDQLVLDTYPFRLLLETAAAAGKEERRSSKALFVDVDAILFEHVLWLARCRDRSAGSLLHLDLKEIIDFYSQDA